MKTATAYLLIFFCSTALFAQTIGTALLGGQSVHDNIKVSFTPVSPSGQSDSTLTDAQGNYSINLVPGAYEVKFTKPGFQSIHYATGAPQFLVGGDTLLTVTLPVGIFKQIQGLITGTLFADTTYLVVGNLTVPVGGELDIEPGTQLLFDDGVELEVQGKIKAIGQPGLPIVFAANTQGGFSEWVGITLAPAGSSFVSIDTMHFEWVLIDGAVDGLKSYNSHGSPPIQIEVNNSVLRHCADACMSLSGEFSANITANEVYGFGYVGIGLFTSSNSDVNVTCNEVHTAPGAGIYSFDSQGDHYIAGNFVHDLRGNFAFAIRPRKTAGVITVENNLVANCDAGIAETRNGQTPDLTTIQNNVVFNCDQGFNFTGTGGAIVRMNVVLNCLIGMEQYSPNFGTPGALSYNAFFNNVDDLEGLTFPGIGVPVVPNANGDTSDIYFNLFSDPQIAAPNVWFPNGSSPLIDAGDPAVVADTNGTVADIGLRSDFLDCPNLLAFATRLQVLTSTDVDRPAPVEMTVYPNPSTGMFRISTAMEVQEVHLYSLDGQEIRLRTQGDAYAADEIARGMYILRVETPNGMQVKKLMFD